MRCRRRNVTGQSGASPPASAMRLPAAGVSRLGGRFWPDPGTATPMPPLPGAGRVDLISAVARISPSCVADPPVAARIGGRRQPQRTLPRLSLVRDPSDEPAGGRGKRDPIAQFLTLGVHCPVRSHVCCGGQLWVPSSRLAACGRGVQAEPAQARGLLVRLRRQPETTVYLAAPKQCHNCGHGAGACCGNRRVSVTCII